MTTTRELVRKMRESVAIGRSEMAKLTGVAPSSLQALEASNRPAELTITDQRYLLAVLQVLCSVSIVDYPTRMRRLRIAVGCSMRQAARDAGVDEETWRFAESEQTKNPMRPRTRAKIDRLLARWESELAAKRAA